MHTTDTNTMRKFLIILVVEVALSFFILHIYVFQKYTTNGNSSILHIFYLKVITKLNQLSKP